MAVVIIAVAAVQGGWSVASPYSACDLMFASGAHAETKARELARLALALGSDAEIAIHDRGARLIARVPYPRPGRSSLRQALPADG